MNQSPVFYPVPSSPQMPAMSLHVRRLDAGIIVWASAPDRKPSPVVASAWVLPGESFLGFSYPQLRAVADRAATSEGM